MTVGRICQREVDLADASETAQAIAQRMGARCVGCLVVLDDRKRPVGIVTDRDLAIGVVGAGLNPRKVEVGDLMSPDPKTVTEQTPIEEALHLMREGGVRRMPVVGWDGRLVGVVTLDDILGLLADEFREMGALLAKTSPRKLATEDSAAP